MRIVCRGGLSFGVFFLRQTYMGILYLIFQRQFVEGIAGTGGK